MASLRIRSCYFSDFARLPRQKLKASKQSNRKVSQDLGSTLHQVDMVSDKTYCTMQSTERVGPSCHSMRETHPSRSLMCIMH